MSMRVENRTSRSKPARKCKYRPYDPGNNRRATFLGHAHMAQIRLHQRIEYCNLQLSSPHFCAAQRSAEPGRHAWRLSMDTAADLALFRAERDALAFLGLLSSLYLRFDPPIGSTDGSSAAQPTHFQGLNIHALISRSQMGRGSMSAALMTAGLAL